MPDNRPDRAGPDPSGSDRAGAHLSGPHASGAGTPLTLEDRLAITELISLHGHLVDDGHLDRLGELFTAEALYDLTEFDQGRLTGVAAIREAALALGAANPVAHHVTNVVVGDRADQAGCVRVRSKGLGITAEGARGSVSYEDIVVRTPAGWRIRYRKVCPRRVPLSGAVTSA